MNVPTCEHGKPLPELFDGSYLAACFCEPWNDTIWHAWGCTCERCERVAPK